MGLDISKIVNAELKKLAYIRDVSGDGNLNREEFISFKKDAGSRDDISAEHFNQAMGLYKTTPIENSNVVENKIKDNNENNRVSKNTEEIGNVSPFSGFHGSIYKKDYQNFIEKIASSVFGRAEKLSLEEFAEREKEFMNSHRNLGVSIHTDSSVVSDDIPLVASLDGDNRTISQEEYKTLFAACDAKVDAPNHYPCTMDGVLEPRNTINDPGLNSHDVTVYHQRLKMQKMSKEELLNDLQSNLEKLSEKHKGSRALEIYEKLALAMIYRGATGLSSDSMSLEEFYEYCTGYDFVPIYDVQPEDIPDWVKPLRSKGHFEYLLKSKNGYECHMTMPCGFLRECDIYTKDGESYTKMPFRSTLKELGLE